MGAVSGHKPKGLMRLALRLPIWLYRLHLGWLLGHRMLMLTHTGRKSGLPRRTVIEVVRYDPATGVNTIASGWGEKADWLRNIVKTPDVHVSSAGRAYGAVARRLSIEDATDALTDYAQRHPSAFNALSKFMLGKQVAPTRDGCATIAQSVPLVVLEPKA